MAKPEKIKTKKKIILSHLLPLNEWVLSIEEELKRKNKNTKKSERRHSRNQQTKMD